MKILRINMQKKTFKFDAVPPAWVQLGGRGLIAQILLDEVPPDSHPLGRQSKLIFASGLLSGYSIPSCDRISIGGKSPLTGGVKESNAGGTTGLHLARLGIKALIIEDFPAEKDYYVLHLSAQNVLFEQAGSLVHSGTYECAHQLREKYGTKVGIALIGPAGIRQFASAGINHLDNEGHPSRVAGRGGLGAVMGSKGIKAIVFDSTTCKVEPPVDPKGLVDTRKKFAKNLLSIPQVEVWRDYGTAANVAATNMLGCFPTRGFSQGRFEQSEAISGDSLRDLLLERPEPSTPTHSCMTGCIIRCSNILAAEDGQEIVAPLEYETIGLMGGNLGIGDLDSIGQLNWYANDLGIDTIELGASLGVAAQAGWFDFGNTQQIVEWIQKIYQATPEGRLLASGASAVGKELGIERIPAVKGQALAAYDPRALKGTGITYATSPQGADHTAGFTLRAKVNHLDPDSNIPVSRLAQINTAAIDSLGACLMVSAGFASDPNLLKEFLSCIYGWEVGMDIQQEIGKNVIRLEREYNKRIGFNEEDDRLPEWFSDEPLPPTQAVFDVSQTSLQSIFKDL